MRGRVGVFVALVFVAAGCGGSDGKEQGSATSTVAVVETTSAPASSPETSASANSSAPETSDSANSSLPDSTSPDDCVAAAQAVVDEGEVPLRADLPTESFDMSVAKGATIWSIEPNLTIGSVKALEEGLSAATQAAGIDLHTFDGKGQVTVWNDGISQAVAQRADAIVINGINPELVSGPLADAEAAGIPVISLSNYEPDAKIDPTLDGVQTSPYRTQGAWAAAAALVRGGCSGTYGFYTTTVFPAIVAAQEGASALIESLCKDCKVTVIDLPPDKLVAGVAPALNGLLNGDPNLRAMIGTDTAIRNSVPVLEEAGRTDIPLIGFLGNAESFDLVRSGAQAVDVVNSPFTYQGWVIVDLAGRAIAGKPTVTAQVGLQIMTADNAPAAPAVDLSAQLGDYQSAFLKLWGLG